MTNNTVERRKRAIEDERKTIYQSKQPFLSSSDFPPVFVFGIATSAYQVEGGSNEGGRGPSIWDDFSHTPGNICDGSNGDVGADQYHRYNASEDIELITKLGFKAYRFSISWTRIFPGKSQPLQGLEVLLYDMKSFTSITCLYPSDIPKKFSQMLRSPCLSLNCILIGTIILGFFVFLVTADGLGSIVNDEGIMHYDNLINAFISKVVTKRCRKAKVEQKYNLRMKSVPPFVEKYFAIYAETCFTRFSDRVKKWITINEPRQTAINGYCTGINAPGRHDHSLSEPLLAAHHQLLAHAEAVSIYRNKFKDKQGGQIGIALDCEWAEALSEREEVYDPASKLALYLDPIFYGDYPETMRERLGEKLPEFSQKDKELLRNSLDFVGLNHYTTRFIVDAETNSEDNDVFYRVQGMERIAEWEGGEVIGEKAASPWLYVVPWGIWKLLNYMASRHNNTAIYITENGAPH
ncbi:beta-glucosidase 42-like [Coffea arabica]|uniref:Beta-glucosidase 42-like n=1 Tax=Coffea arabica TaxID=13443 RepID=A0ABM4VML8_COFAR